MSWPDEKQQGKRVLLAMIMIMTVVPIVAAVLLVSGIFLLEFIWGGEEAVARAMTEWDKPSPYAQDGRFIIGLILMGCIAAGIPVATWYRFFVKTGYLTKRTLDGIDQGQLPVIGGYLKPFSYLFFIWSGIYGAYIGYQQSIYILMVFFGVGGIWFIYLGFQELIRWYRGKK